MLNSVRSLCWYRKCGWAELNYIQNSFAVANQTITYISIRCLFFSMRQKKQHAQSERSQIRASAGTLRNETCKRTWNNTSEYHQRQHWPWTWDTIVVWCSAVFTEHAGPHEDAANEAWGRHLEEEATLSWRVKAERGSLGTHGKGWAPEISRYITSTES